MLRHLPALGALIGILGSGLACSPPPGQPVGVVRLALVPDSYIFSVIQVIEVHVLRASTATGPLTCAELQGSRFNPGDARFQPVVQPQAAVLAGHNPSLEVELPIFEVPANERMVFFARGLTQWSVDPANPFPVGQGCVDDQVFQAGTSNPISLDMTAATGGACREQTDCPKGLSCQRTEGAATPFEGGYCAMVGCAGDQSCPPGSRCISSGTSGGTFCLRGCSGDRDCTTVADPHSPQAVQLCVGRSGPTPGGCGKVCVFPNWNIGGKCGQ